MMVAGSQIGDVTVTPGFAQGSAPGVRERRRKALRQALCELKVHRMLGGTARIGTAHDGSVLRIN